VQEWLDVSLGQIDSRACYRGTNDVIASGSQLNRVMRNGPPVLTFLPLATHVILRQCMTWTDLSQPPLARSMSKAAVGSTQGLLTGATAIGFTIANVSGGWLADTLGFGNLPWAGPD